MCWLSRGELRQTGVFPANRKITIWGAAPGSRGLRGTQGPAEPWKKPRVFLERQADLAGIDVLAVVSVTFITCGELLQSVTQVVVGVAGRERPGAVAGRNEREGHGELRACGEITEVIHSVEAIAAETGRERHAEGHRIGAAFSEGVARSQTDFIVPSAGTSAGGAGSGQFAQ